MNNISILPNSDYEGGSPFEGKRIDELMAKMDSNCIVTQAQFRTFIDGLTHKSNKLTWIAQAGPRVRACSSDWLLSLVSSLTFKDEKMAIIETFGPKLDNLATPEQREEIAQALTFGSEITKAKGILGI